MKIAVLFAGQGSQVPGMGKELYEANTSFSSVIDQACAYADRDLKTLMFEDPDGTLSETRNTQPCLAAFAAGVWQLLKEMGVQADYAAGLSLGEYSALYAAGVLSLEDLMTLTVKRGGFMTEAGKGMDALMCAILGLDGEVLSGICENVTASGIGRVEISNYNAVGQIVISGEKPAVEKAAEAALEAGAKRAMTLNTSGAFHTSFMAPAGEELKALMTEMNLDEKAAGMVMPVIFNVTAQPMGSTPDETLTSLLVRQVQQPVKMAQTIQYLESQGVDTILEIGPGKTLSGFVRRTAKGIKCLAIEKPEDLEKVRAYLAQEEA
ncbi:MAG: ACP S-malonyltransferase [Lachnospiraceae bacterium]|nr:ACP S-malonyltransferase [Lachnospiraceae bacterium]